MRLSVLTGMAPVSGSGHGSGLSTEFGPWKADQIARARDEVDVNDSLGPRSRLCYRQQPAPVQVTPGVKDRAIVCGKEWVCWIGAGKVVLTGQEWGGGNVLRTLRSVAERINAAICGCVSLQERIKREGWHKSQLLIVWSRRTVGKKGRESGDDGGVSVGP